ncbi:permease prefix domain 1-containing protein [Butyrivibrio sp. VCB2006]|uniref:permease prefix domain 1-containing protein n=1 Tax=Butyrivibrio sp. VCB2006 TaxID=1280679 RepID=UPI0003F8D0BA|nr:permease prefix domain 1-containing protein [Butyrivibrio sp. VCB2006]
METIKNYLEAMFANLPNTVEVKNAKDELLSMMEDKYTELINEGKPENEAVGIVISEFGNLDELAESLGIATVINQEDESTDRRMLSTDEVINFVADYTRRRFVLAFGVMMCIFAPIGPIMFSALGETIGFGRIELVGVLFLFVFAAIGVGAIVFSAFMNNEWKFMDKELCTIDLSTAEAIARSKSENQMTRGLYLTIGIVLCIISIIPVIVLDTVFSSGLSFITEGIGPSFIFIGAGIGVLLIQMSSAKDAAYSKLLSLNDVNTVAGNYEPVKKERKNYVSSAAKDIMSMYWKIVLCIYLIASFTSFNWGSTWLIWPIAGVLRKPIEKILCADRG